MPCVLHVSSWTWCPLMIWSCKYDEIGGIIHILLTCFVLIDTLTTLTQTDSSRLKTVSTWGFTAWLFFFCKKLLKINKILFICSLFFVLTSWTTQELHCHILINQMKCLNFFCWTFLFWAFLHNWTLNIPPFIEYWNNIPKTVRKQQQQQKTKTKRCTAQIYNF